MGSWPEILWRVKKTAVRYGESSSGHVVVFVHSFSFPRSRMKLVLCNALRSVMAGLYPLSRLMERVDYRHNRELSLLGAAEADQAISGYSNACYSTGFKEGTVTRLHETLVVLIFFYSLQNRLTDNMKKVLELSEWVSQFCARQSVSLCIHHNACTCNVKNNFVLLYMFVSE